MDHLYEPDVVDLTNTPPAGADGAYRPTLVPHPPSGTVPLVDDPSAEVIRLQAEVAILQARLQASEELARERAERQARKAETQPAAVPFRQEDYGRSYATKSADL